jgi:hypothetical protein
VDKWGQNSREHFIFLDKNHNYKLKKNEKAVEIVNDVSNKGA